MQGSERKRSRDHLTLILTLFRQNCSDDEEQNSTSARKEDEPQDVDPQDMVFTIPLDANLSNEEEEEGKL
jgi:hypothetical protein